MIGNLLLRGMLVGVFAGILAFGFAKVFGEPRVDSAIAFEESMHADEAPAPANVSLPASASTPADMSMATEAAMPADHADEVELVSRPTQAGIGLFTGVVLYSAAFGGIFALVFAFAYGRFGPADPRALAVVLALLGFVVLIVVPDLKYPANPPSVGNGGTIGYRTWLFFGMLAASIVAVAAAIWVRARFVDALGSWNATLVAGAAFIVVAAIAMLVLPAINEVPEGFPASLLWQFRIASLGTQAVLWTTLGLAFGLIAERSLVRTR
ncbi:MAG TPA: CbtA family protein [Bauldia sp.]|nr:CbtA family protein [Bauldia sp.]